MAGENVKTFTTANWNEEVLGSDKAVLVDFWAAWCGPCRMVAPIIEELADEMAGRVIIGKLNVDEEPAIAGQYQVMSIPTLAVFKNGQVVDKSVGFRGKADLVKMIEKHA
ncbi:thioredoxin [Desulfitobacterium hafniense DCB-2]|uniref:Thioredoxin n=3 Tax=Desulfitobacterium hafniense TaxID=49338 RepID=A0A098B2C3_DESHA|nr:thioredoxin [Desulfitobacterium hafniense]ACL21601.1 thioredoxin [Desulfitobacterium hafniense DCB-2]EHL07716.1 thioredoxin [Desulfitobacterium hafniense DP7]CDX02515.1 Thioredoxin [Desulfitobacterium hafniense]